jgi:hypothetical protein
MIRYRQKLFTTSERERDRDEDYSIPGNMEMQTDCFIQNLQDGDTYTVYGQICNFSSLLGNRGRLGKKSYSIDERVEVLFCS